MMLRTCVPLILLTVHLGLLGAPAGATDREVLVATTTSVRDSGLLDELLPVFSKRTGIHVRVIAVGSGAALRMGSEGNADLLITHAPDAEAKLVASGAALSRRPFMENHFVIAGPPDDPAGIARAPSAVDAFRRLVEAQAPYVSRGDDSGTHRREVALLEAAGVPTAGGWEGFIRTGAGMGLTLQVAGERRAYVLSDIGTFLAFQKRIALTILSRPEPALQNVYAVLRVNPERFAGRIQARPASVLEAFLLGRKAQELIARFGRKRFGQPLFRPLLLLAAPNVPDA
jgi:tungstate transport system substrate-binding protein